MKFNFSFFFGGWAVGVQQTPVLILHLCLPVALTADARSLPCVSTTSKVFAWEALMAQILRLVILENQL